MFSRWNKSSHEETEEEIRRNKDIKKRLISEFSSAVRELQRVHVGADVEVERNDENAFLICTLLEAVFLHGYQSQMFKKNNTYYGISAVNTGQENIDLLEQYTMWRNKRELSWWSDSYANMINGTDGSQTKPHLSKHDVIRVFSPQICRSIYAVYKTTKQVRGIELYRYAAPDEMYLSGDLYPANKGFCVPPGCLPTGLLNISLCQPMNPPVVISPPHFYQCNKSLLDAIDGLHPDKDLHGTHMDIEPITGITMNARKRLQVNIAMHPSTLIKPTDGKFNPVFLPALFIEEKAEIDEHDASKFKETVYIPILLTKVVEWGLVALGVTLIIIAIVLLVCRPRKNSYAPVQMEEEKTPLLGEEK